MDGATNTKNHHESQPTMKHHQPKTPKITPTKGLLTLITTTSALTLITTGYAYTTYTPTWALALITLTCLTIITTTALALIQHNNRTTVLPHTYAELLETHAKFPIDPKRIKLTKFKTDTKNPFTTGTPHRITLTPNQTILPQKTDFTDIKNTLHFITDETYTLNLKKSKKKKIVFDALTPEALHERNKQPELTYRQNIEQRLTTVVTRLIDENANITCTWDNDDYLTTVEITDFQNTEIALPNKRKQVMLQLKTTLPKGDFNTYFDAHEQIIRFFRSTPLPKVTAPPTAKARLIKTHDDYLNFKVYYGIGTDGKPAYWQPSKDAHMLAIGGTGGGKTIFEHGVIQQLAQAGARVWLLDGKRVEFKGYRNYPNIEILAQKIEQQVRLVKMAFDLMETRYDLIERDEVSISELEPVFLVIDEVKTFLSSADRLYKKTKEKGMPTKSEVLDWLSDMGSLARTAKIHMVFGLQRPDAEFIGGELRDNFGARVSLGQLQSNVGSMMMWNNPAIGVQVPKIPGRAISFVDGVPGQIQVPFTANPDPQHKDFVASMVAATYPEWEIYSRKVIAEPRPEAVLDKNGDYTGEEVLTWSSIISTDMLDPITGKKVDVPPVASEESRALRASDAHDKPVEESQLMPRAVDSFSEALSIFEGHTDLSFGARVARAVQRVSKAEAEELEAKPNLAAEGYEAASQKLMNAHLNFDDAQEVSSENITGGMRITDPATGEKILVSETSTISGTDQIAVTGFSEDGEEVSVELAASQKVECARLIEA
ncbi:FtsK/SpoIIIE domain-containing protein [Microbacterium foliorum]